jgi:sulfite exporter TauE/SafE
LSQYWGIVISGILLGLSTGVYCLGACAPMLIPYILSEDGSGAKRNTSSTFGASLRILIEFSAGRLIAYVAFGVASGLVGFQMQGPVAKRIIGIALLAGAVMLLLYGISKNFPGTRLCSLLGGKVHRCRIPFILGIITGVNICPPFVQAIAYTIGLGSVLKGVVLFLAFFTGTSLYLTPLVFSGFVAQVERLRSAAQIAVLFAAVWFLIYGIDMLVS